MRAFDRCKSDLKVDQQGKFPLDAALLELYTSPQVVFHLFPTPGSSLRKRSRPKSVTTPTKPKQDNTTEEPPEA